MTGEPATVTITFVNDSESDVEVDFFSNADASVSPSDLTDPESSERLLFTALANDSFRYLQTCDLFGSAQIALASVITETGPGAMASTGILVDSMDFSCGNFVTFTLTQPEDDTLLIDISVTESDPLTAKSQKRRASIGGGLESGTVDQSARTVVFETG